MYYENDYVMRMIKDSIRMLSVMINGKKTEQSETLENTLSTGRPFLDQLLLLAEQGSINEAENLLYKDLDPSDYGYLDIGLHFYDYLNNFQDVFLEEHHYSRQEILQGIQDFSSEFGLNGIEDFMK